jgi:hypothetical protein
MRGDETRIEEAPTARSNAVAFVVEALVNVVLPFAIYMLAKRQMSEAQALLAASAPPLLWSIVEFVRHRRLDAVSLLVLCGIALSLLAFAGGGGVKALQLREKLVTGLVGLIFLGSVAIGRPLIYFLARATIARTSSSKASSFAALRDDRAFRHAMLVMTVVWGVGLTGECALSIALTYVFTVEQFLIVGPIVGYGLLTALTLWTFWYARRSIGPAMLAMMEAGERAGAPKDVPRDVHEDAA